MHPGWADTAGVQTSLPRFQKYMEKRLRNSDQGADTIVWLAIANHFSLEESGLFWFDRSHVKEHLFPWTKSTDQQKEDLWDMLEKHLQQYASF